MTPAQRRQQIAALASADGKVTVSALATRFQVADMTIRRDLEAMESDGRVRRVFGGAIPTVSRSYEPPFVQRTTAHHAEKAAIGAAAAKIVQSGDTVIIDVGTTALEVARALRGTQGLIVVTASLPVASELGNATGIRLIVTGGEVRHGELSLTGGMAEDAFTQMNCDLAVIGVAGIRAEPGLTEYNPEDARVKRAAIKAARRTIVVADGSKLGAVAFAAVAPLSAVDTLVTDASADETIIAQLTDAGIEVVVAPQDLENTPRHNEA